MRISVPCRNIYNNFTIYSSVLPRQQTFMPISTESVTLQYSRIHPGNAQLQSTVLLRYREKTRWVTNIDKTQWCSFYICMLVSIKNVTYSRTSIARTPMARLPWLIRTRFFESLQNSSDSSRKQIFREIFLLNHEIVCCVYSLESPHRGDSNEYTQHTIIV